MGKAVILLVVVAVCLYVPLATRESTSLSNLISDIHIANTYLDCASGQYSCLSLVDLYGILVQASRES